MEIRKLNTLRGLAALIVLVSHYGNGSGSWGAFGHGAGQLGVMLFFILSAFLMSYIYLDQPPSFAALRRYAVARIARIIPLFCIVVVVSYVVNILQVSWYAKVAFPIGDLEALLSHLLFLYGVDVLWSIPPEVHCYVLFACIWVLRPHIHIGWLIVLLIVLLCVANILQPVQYVENFELGVLIARLIKVLPCFVVGMVFGGLFNRWQPSHHLCSHWYLGVLLLIPLLYPEVFMLLTGNELKLWADWWVQATVSIIFFVVVFLVPSGNPILENFVGDWIGRISYSLYLLHSPLLLVLKRLGWLGEGGLLLFIVAALVVAHISYTLVEAPMRWCLRDWARFCRQQMD